MRRKFKRPLTFLLALLLLFSLTGASVQAEESAQAGISDYMQTVVMQEDGTQKEDDVGATASTEENVQQEIPEISAKELQQEESQKEQSDKTDGNDALQEKISSENQTGETVNDSDEEKDAQNAAEADLSETENADASNAGTYEGDISERVSSGVTAQLQDVSGTSATVEPQAAGSITVAIQDDIENTGTLTAQLTGDAPNGITLEWYKHAEGGNTWTKVERHKVTGDFYNVSEDGSALNVALDKGARCYYKVQVKDASGQLLAESAALQVSYYNQLENGDFETPATTKNTGYQPFYSNGTPGLIWKTTASDAEIEYVSAATDKYDKNTGKTHAQQSQDWHKVEAAASGTQFAELNANEPGALYQDVLTTPRAKLYWKLYHRGRGTTAYDNTQTDTMYVLIMSTKLAKQYNVDNQTAVQDVITNVRNSTGKYPGASVATITDDNVQWYYHAGDYDVSENQYLTRFFFVAGATAYDGSGDTSAKKGTVGNHLDNVSFSETLPDPNPDTGHLQITKTVRGLSEDNAASYSLQLKITAPDQKVKTVTLHQFSRNEDGSYSCTYTETNVAAGTYRIEEILPSGLPDYRVDSTFNGEEATKGNVTVQDQKTATAEIVNTYTYDIVLPPTGISGAAVPMAVLVVTAFGAGTAYLIFFRRRKLFR